MADSQYFSFFGAVEVPERPHPALVRAARAAEKGAEHGTVSAGRRAFGRAFARAGIQPERVDLGCDGAVGATAFVHGDQALLVVDRTSLEDEVQWLEAGVVLWPLRFAMPAQIAGACCTPRFGLVR